MNSIYVKGELTLYFKDDLDNLAIMNLKDSAVKMIDQYKAKTVRFDFRDVTFVDSTGIGFILARYNQISKYGGTLIVRNMSGSVKKLFALSGIFQIIQTENDIEQRGVVL